MNRLEDFCPRPLIFTVSIPGLTLTKARREVFPITPGPMIATDFASSFAKYYAANTGNSPCSAKNMRRFADTTARVGSKEPSLPF